jgi:hypothetical protein
MRLLTVFTVEAGCRCCGSPAQLLIDIVWFTFRNRTFPFERTNRTFCHNSHERILCYYQMCSVCGTLINVMFRQCSGKSFA